MSDELLSYGCPRCDDRGTTIERRRNYATMSPSDDEIVTVRCTHPGCRAATELEEGEVEA